MASLSREPVTASTPSAGSGNGPLSASSPRSASICPVSPLPGIWRRGRGWPGNNITGGKRHSGKTTKGDVWLKDMLTQCAWSAARTRDTYLSAQFWRLAKRLGEKKAAVAVGHSILVICWHLLTDDCDYFARRGDTNRHQQNLVRQLQDLGYAVTL